MSQFRLHLSPTVRNPMTEGSMDTSISNGVSAQRTGYIEVPNGSNRKIVEIADGTTFDDVMQTLTDITGVEAIAED